MSFVLGVVSLFSCSASEGDNEAPVDVISEDGTEEEQDKRQEERDVDALSGFDGKLEAEGSIGFSLGDVLALPLESSPGFRDGAASFDSFCVGSAGDVSIENAAWLSYFSANEYSNPFERSKMLVELGFGNELDRVFRTCVDELDALRFSANEMTLEDFNALPGECTRSWVRETFGEPNDNETVVVPGKGANLRQLFGEHLLETQTPLHDIEFFTDGGFSADSSNGDEINELGTTQASWAKRSNAETNGADTVVVTFRGTEFSQLQDVFTNLAFFQRSLEDFGFSSEWGSAHRGFLGAAFSSGLDALRERLRALDGSGTEVWITGHSLGAALATLFVADVLNMIENEGLELNLKGLYTFGSPRVGNSRFVSTLQGALRSHGVESARFRNDRDTVTRIPKWGYSHLDTLAFLKDDFGNGRWLEYDISIREPWFSSVNDHSSSRYYSKLLEDFGNREKLPQALQCQREE